MLSIFINNKILDNINRIMPGGEIQLDFYGIQDLYLTGNPQITFFKCVYRRYTYFSMESIRVDFDVPKEDKYLLIDKTRELSCKIPRSGDLISNIYFVCKLPDIYSYSDFENTINGSDSGHNDYSIATDFKWIKNIGFNMIESES